MRLFFHFHFRFLGINSCSSPRSPFGHHPETEKNRICDILFRTRASSLPCSSARVAIPLRFGYRLPLDGAANSPRKRKQTDFFPTHPQPPDLCNFV
jgi:hypothetical protein